MAVAEEVAYPDEYNTPGYDTAAYYENESSSISKAYLPTQTYYEFLGPMDSHRGPGHLSIQHWALRTNVGQWQSGKWGGEFKASLRASWFDGAGAARLDVDRLYTIGISADASYQVGDRYRLMFGVTPQISTDFDTWSNKDIYFGGHIVFAGQVNEKLSGGIGIAYYPQLGSWPLLPVLQFNYKLDDYRSLELEGLRFSYKMKVNDAFTWGPFVNVSSGTWTVNRHRQTHQLQWTSGVAGLCFDIGLGKWGSATPRLVTDVGFTFGNSGSINTSNGRHELEKYHYNPGFYLRAALNFNF